MRKVLEWSIEKHRRQDDRVKYMAYKCKRIKEIPNAASGNDLCALRYY
jgi:hypothetical protein